jgi:tRNA-2-methylthio-N6-dimethylallyladenosine synthase
MSLIEDIGFVQAYSFKYSPRPGTPAAVMRPQVPEDVKDARLQILQRKLTEQSRAFNAGCVGQTLEVLLTGPGRNPGQLVGRTPYLQPVHVVADARYVGTVRSLKIAAVGSNSLMAQPEAA